MGRGIGIFGIALFGYLIWVFASADPFSRINRACEPIDWAGNVTESLFAIAFPDYRHFVTDAKADLTYTCKYSLWRLFYEQEYLNAQRPTGHEK